MTGTLNSAICLRNLCPSRDNSIAFSGVSIFSINRMSAPAMKTLSLPLTITTTLSAGSLAIASRIFLKHATVSTLKMLARALGSSNVIQPMPSASTAYVTGSFMMNHPFCFAPAESTLCFAKLLLAELCEQRLQLVAFVFAGRGHGEIVPKHDHLWALIVR